MQKIKKLVHLWCTHEGLSLGDFKVVEKICVGDGWKARDQHRILRRLGRRGSSKSRSVWLIMKKGMAVSAWCCAVIFLSISTWNPRSIDNLHKMMMVKSMLRE